MRVAFLLLVAATAAAAQQQGGGLIAVLEFKNHLSAASREELDITYFGDVVRSESLKAAPGVRVITRENLVVLLQSTGKKLEECEGECEVDTGRRIGADYVISGDLRRVGTTFHLSLRIHDTRSGELLAGATASGKTVDELDSSTAQAVVELVAPLRARIPPPTAHQEECQDGDLPGCVRAGLAVDRSKGGDPARAVALYRKACEAGEPSGCNNLAVHLRNGQGVQKDEARAAELFGKACDAGAAPACNQLGLSLDARDPAKAAALYRKACDGGDPGGCNNLGVDLQGGLGVARDDAKAAELFRKACGSGMALACWHAAFAYERGQGAVKDAGRAAALFQQACKLGLQQGCGR